MFFFIILWYTAAIYGPKPAEKHPFYYFSKTDQFFETQAKVKMSSKALLSVRVDNGGDQL
jgi:hypothetical protein